MYDKKPKVPNGYLLLSRLPQVSILLSRLTYNYMDYGTVFKWNNYI